MAPQYIFTMPSWNHKKLLFTHEEVRDSFNFQYQAACANELPNDARDMMRTRDENESLRSNRGSLTDGNGNGNGSGDTSADLNFEKALERFANDREVLSEILRFNTGHVQQNKLSIHSLPGNEEMAAALQILEACPPDIPEPSIDFKSAFQIDRKVPRWYSSVPISATDKLADQIMIKLEKLRPNVLYINTKRAEANITVLCKDEEKDLMTNYAYEVGRELHKREVLSFGVSKQVKILAKVVICEIELKAIRDLVKID